MKNACLIPVLLLIGGQSFANGNKENSNTPRKIASVEVQILHDCGQIQLKYDSSTFYVDGVDIGPRFFVEDSTDGKTYDGRVGNLSSEGGDFFVDNFRGNLQLKFVVTEGHTKRTAMLSNGEKLPCKFVKPARKKQ